MFAEDRIEYDIEYGGGIVGEGCGDIYGGIIEESMRHLSVLSSQVEEGGPLYPTDYEKTLAWMGVIHSMK